MRLLRFRNLPLFIKLLIPFLALTLFLGGFGVTLVVRDLSARAQTALDRDLTRRSLDARALLRDRELYLLESVNFSANLQGVTEGIKNSNTSSVARLMQSVLALKGDLNLVAATGANGDGLVEFTRMQPAGAADRRSGTRWADIGFVRSALADSSGKKSVGFLRAGSGTMLAIASPVCSGPEGCQAVGVTIVGIRIEALAAAARGASTANQNDVGVALYDGAGKPLASDGIGGAEQAAPAPTKGGQLRRTRTVGGVEVATLYSPLEIGGKAQGTLAVSGPTAPAFASVKGTRFRLALVLLAAMVGAVALGAMMSRLILKQVRPLVETNRALGGGDLSARAPVMGDDELGELAQGVNQMAEQLQAIYDTLELQVAQRTEEIRRLLKERTEFFASISHELRTPLAIIQGKAKMMADPTYKKTPQWTSDAGKTIGNTTGQLLNTVNDILELARAESGRIEVAIEDVSLSDVVKDLRPTIEGLAKASGLKAGISVGRDLPQVRADKARLKEVIVNLVDNAVKYTPAGGKVALSAAAHNGSVEISVSDTGIGIPEQAGELIFEPFFRVKGVAPQRGQASTGLGLALAKRLVEVQGGRIWFTSTPGEGTTFTFTVDRVKA